jgi:8-oxo-dGTP diphosphatase
MDYVLGVIYDINRGYVLLIEKSKPDWQAGKLNGVGGKIEPGETPLEAMVRETDEETGLTVTEWRHYATLRFNGHDRVFVYDANHSFNNVRWARLPGEEKLFIVGTDRIRRGYSYALPNLAWLVSMGFDTGFGSHLTVDYGEPNS